MADLARPGSDLKNQLEFDTMVHNKLLEAERHAAETETRHSPKEVLKALKDAIAGNV